MNKLVIGIALGAFLCAAGCALGQLHHPAGSSAGWHNAPETPAQKARMNQIDRLDQTAWAALDAGNYAEAEADARQSVTLGIASGLGQELLAQALYAQGKDAEALQVYQAIADAGGVFPRNMLPYALLLLKAGQWAQAVAAYNKQLPYLSDGDMMLAHSHFSPDAPQPQELEAAIHIGLGLTGDFRGNHWNRGVGDPTASEFRKALALEPDSALAHYYYGHGLWRVGRKAEAKAAFQKAAALDQEGKVKAQAQKEMQWR